MSRKVIIFFAVFVCIFLISYFVIHSKLTTKTTEPLQLENCPPNCNVILISIDALRADHLGVYGYNKATSPNIDQLAKESILFENAFSQSSWTLPSYASMLMGQYSQKLGVEVINDRLPENVSTLAEILKNANYETAAFTSGAFINEDHGFQRGFNQFEEESSWQDAITLTNHATSFVNEKQNSKFFLFLHYFHVHDPYSPNETGTKQFDPNYSGNIKSFDITDIVKLNKGEIKLSKEDLQHIVALYDAEIFEMDNQLGILFKLLEQKGLDKKTIIIINADHGEEFGEHGIWGMHAYSLYDELLHIPLIIKVPNTKGKRVDTLVENRDIPKTISELLKLNQTDFFGQNLIRIAEGEKGSDYIYAETTIQKQQMLGNITTGLTVRKISDLPPQALDVLREQKVKQIKTRMVRTKDFKFIINFNGKTELYNLKNDPSEKNNLAGQRLEEETKLLEKLKDY